MVPHVAERGYSFIGAGKYYLHDKKASTAERVAWAETLNLPTRDAAKAMKCMAWTAMHADELKAAAGVSLKGRKATDGPVYSCSLSWEKGAAPSDGHMRETGLASLAALGLSGHEAVLIRHTDTEHDHLHIVVNLVHPETGSRAKLFKDRLKLSEWAERYEREHGQIVCPQRVENNERRRNGEFVKHREEEARQAPAINELYQSADSGKAFAAAAQAELGLTLAMGHRGRVVLVDEAGKVVALARQLEGRKDIKAKLADLAIKALPDAAALSKERQQQAKQDALEREIAAPMQRQEDLQAAFDKAAQEERSRQQAQATGFEAERDRYEAILREARRQGQEIVVPRQPHAADLAISTNTNNDNRERQSAALLREQQQAWTELEQRQADRRGREERERGQRFRRGLLGYIDKLTGRHREIAEANATERAEADRRDREERERLEATQTRQTAQLHQHHERLQEQRRELEEERSLTPEREQDHTRGQTPDEHSQTLTPGGGGRSRRRGGRASPFRSPLRGRRERRFTGYGGKRTYRASPDRVTPRRGKRFMNAGKKKGGKSANPGRMWTANAFDMMRGRGAAPRPAPLPGGQAGLRTQGPAPGF